MTTFLLLLGTGALAFAGGWFLACIALAQSHMSTARDLDAERQELEDERQALHVAWLANEPPGEVVFALEERRRLTREVIS